MQKLRKSTFYRVFGGKILLGKILVGKNQIYIPCLQNINLSTFLLFALFVASINGLKIIFYAYFYTNFGKNKNLIINS